jgi:hypothetical protein
VSSGDITIKEVERVGGFLVLELSGEAKERYSRAVYYRRRRELREMGLVLADEFYEPVEVRLEEVLERALETPLWE